MQRRTLTVLGFLVILAGFGLIAYLTPPSEGDYTFSLDESPLHALSRRAFGWPPPAERTVISICAKELNPDQRDLVVDDDWLACAQKAAQERRMAELDQGDDGLSAISRR